MRPKTSAVSTTGPTVLVVFGLGSPAIQFAQAQIEFEPAAEFPISTPTSSLALTDMNGDGLQDFVITEELEMLTLFENLGDNQFTRQPLHFNPAARLHALQAADLTDDGYPDLMWMSTIGYLDTLNVLYNSGDMQNLRLETIPYDIQGDIGASVVADLNGDDRPDLVLLGGYRYSGAVSAHVFHNVDGELNLAETIPMGYNDGRDVTVGDMDGDGDVDLAVLLVDDYFDEEYGEWKIYNCSMHILLNDGAGRFPDTRFVSLPYGDGGDDDPIPTSVRAADLDGDGDLDLAVAATSFNNLSSLLNVSVLESIDGGARYEIVRSIDVGRGHQVATVTAGDLDTDGDIDLLINDRESTQLLENNGGFSFANPRSVESDMYQAAATGLGDFNDDGRFDLVNGRRTGLSILTNITPIEGPQIDQTPFVRGEPAAIGVTDANPNEIVHFLYSWGPAGNSFGQALLGGLTLDLEGPLFYIGRKITNSEGRAAFNFTVPSKAPLRTITTQVVMQRGNQHRDSVKTPFRQTRIQP